MDKEPHWINAFDRIPTRHGLYFVKVDGRKEMMRWHEFDRAMQMYASFFWLEEYEDRVTPVAKRSLLDTYTFQRDLEPEPVVHAPVRMSPLIVPPPNPDVQKQIDAWTEHRENNPIVPKRRSPAVNVERRAYRKRVVNERGAVVADDRCIIEREFPPADPCLANPVDAIAYLYKLRIRKEIIDAYRIGEAAAGDKYKPDLYSSPHFTLFEVRKIFPRLKGREEIPTEMVAELNWVYGRSGVNIIARKLGQTYRQVNKRANKKKNGNQENEI